MSYFAEIKDEIVQRVIVADQEFIDSGKVGDPKDWIETSMDGSLRKNYAGIGDIYDKDRDSFINPQPYPSWILDEETCKYKSPTEKPVSLNEFDIHGWNEEKQIWEKVVPNVISDLISE